MIRVSGRWETAPGAGIQLPVGSRTSRERGLAGATMLPETRLTPTESPPAVAQEKESQGTPASRDEATTRRGDEADEASLDAELRRLRQRSESLRRRGHAKFLWELQAALQGQHAPSPVPPPPPPLSRVHSDPSPGVVPPTNFSLATSSHDNNNNNNSSSNQTKAGGSGSQQSQEVSEAESSGRGGEARKSLLALASYGAGALTDVSLKVSELERDALSLRIRLLESQRRERSLASENATLRLVRDDVDTLTQQNRTLKQADVAMAGELDKLRAELGKARAQADHFSRKFLECKRAEEDLQRRYKDMQRQTEAFTRGTETEISRLAGEKIALAAKYERVKRKAQEYKERLVAHIGDPGEGRKEAPPTTSEAAEPRGPGGEREGEVEGVIKMPARVSFPRDVVEEEGGGAGDLGSSPTRSGIPGEDASGSPPRRHAVAGKGTKNNSPGWMPRKRAKQAAAAGSCSGAGPLKQRKLFGSENIDEFFQSQARRGAAEAKPIAIRSPSHTDDSNDCCVVLENGKPVAGHGSGVDLSKYDKYRGPPTAKEENGTPRDYWHIGVTPPPRPSQESLGG